MFDRRLRAIASSSQLHASVTVHSTGMSDAGLKNHKWSEDSGSSATVVNDKCHRLQHTVVLVVILGLHTVIQTCRSHALFTRSAYKWLLCCVWWCSFSL